MHINSGIPNHAFYLAATSIGGNAWEKAGRVWYDTITSRNVPTGADFAMFASMTYATAGKLFGATSTEGDAVREAWTAVGVKIT